MYQGDFAPASTVTLKFNTASFSDGSPITLAGTPAVSVYKQGSTTQSTAGVTLTVDYDTLTGFHDVTIDTSADGTFYAAGNDFHAVITTGTVGGTSVVGRVVGSFSIANRSALRPTTAGRTLDVSATGEAGLDWGNIGSPTTAVALTGTTIATTQQVDVNTIKTQAVTCAAGVTVNANVGTTQPVNFTGTGATAYVKSDMVDVAGAAVSTSAAQIGVNVVNVGGTAQTARDLGNALPAAAAGAAGGLWILGANAAANTTLTGVAASGSTPATPALALTGGDSSTTAGGTAAPGLESVGGAGSSVNNGPAVGTYFVGGTAGAFAAAAHGFYCLGTSVGDGIQGRSGSGSTGSGISGICVAVNGNGWSGQGAGTGDGWAGTGGLTGRGMHLIGGGTSGAGFRAEASAGNSNGVEFVHQGSGLDLSATTTSLQLPSNGLANVTAWTVNITGSLSGNVGGISGVSFPSNFGSLGISAGGHISNVDTLTTYTGNTPQTGDAYARIGATGSGLTSLAPAATALSTAQWTNTRAGYLDNLSGGAVALASGVTVTTNNDKTGYSLVSTGLDLVLVAGKTLPNALKYIGASVAGTLSGSQTTTEVFKDFSGATALTITVDSSGNRSAITYG